jgi:hypothetical protein
MTTQSHIHVNEDADAYAMGALSEIESARVAALAASCAVCAQRVGQAESLVAQLVMPVEPPPELARRIAGIVTPREKRRRRAGAVAVAAAFVVGLLPSIYLVPRTIESGKQTRAQSRVLASLVHSHFLHAPFVSISQGALGAKAIYARDGSWVYLVADAPRALMVRTEPGDKTIGTLQPDGNAASLYFTNTARIRAIVLYDGSRAVARVALVY